MALPAVSGLLLNKGCENFTSCPTVYMPVCGSNGHTYNNACHLKMEACTTCDEKLHIIAEFPCLR